ncbi:MAG TPA: TadE family protein [Candidatus Limnocylindrales bacterium]|nr:TadE family protein [Candidatus Limnocylindrales bacterium]
MTSRLRLRPTRRGQALAEFAIVVPIFLLMLMALFDLGRAVFINNGLANAAREAARLAIVNQDVDLVLQRAQAMSFGVTIATPPSDLVAYYRDGPNVDDVESNEPCDNSDADHLITTGCVAVVKTDATWEPITPLVGTIVGQLSLSARSELPIEFVCPNPTIAGFATSDLCPKQP